MNALGSFNNPMPYSGEAFSKSLHPMSYKQALKAASKVGAAHAQGLPHLAQMCAVLAPLACVIPEHIYITAARRSLSGDDVRRMAAADPLSLLDLALEAA